DQDDDVVEKLRRLARVVPITRDRMLKVIDVMPDFIRERTQQMAERFTILCTRLQGFLTKLPEGAVLPTTATGDLYCLRREIEDELRDIDLLLADLRLFLEPDDEALRRLHN